MAKIYFNLIINGRKTLDDVPARLKMQVEQMLYDYYNEHIKDLTEDEKWRIIIMLKGDKWILPNRPD